MHDLNFREMTKEQLAEESLIDLAYAFLEERKSAIAFADLVKELQSLNGFSDEEIKSRLVQFYTDMNIDGRFLLNHESGWGLREWYKVETIEEETAPTVKTRKKKSKAVIDDEDEIIELDEEDIVFDEDFDEFTDDEEEEEDEIEEDDALEFVEEDIEDLDADIDEELIPEEEEEFVIDDEEEEEDLDDLEDFDEEEEK
ncbi:DNA-directed RNA polymerase subunit delta [Lysinibacillus odysseyi 34hs-1 = NBRC 100172]|uniref:Probable DNA-directed RNA polymerase subunit delta n=2 Tax=Lysinibacillus odysseyi TaxID=202611 RepID=A0A0A3JFA4_9BACI|nr:DNA-directed RNA polymerase subunit delta [Lysinibacillus odysseyi 34hs-1 = NBRC 100172]